MASFVVSCPASGQLAPPVITPFGGVFVGPATVTLTAAAGTTIYYTLDGSTPSVLGARYTAPIVLTQSAWVRAIATMAGAVASSTSEVSFTIVP